jgi:hypothetical protein
MEDKVMRGTPPAVLLPANNYVFKVLNDHHVTEIPRRGKYSDIAPDFFKEDAGEFDILSDTGILYMPAITKVLFATKKYPDLKFNQLFIPHTFKIEDDKVIIVGQVIELLLKTTTFETEDEV